MKERWSFCFDLDVENEASDSRINKINSAVRYEMHSSSVLVTQVLLECIVGQGVRVQVFRAGKWYNI